MYVTMPATAAAVASALEWINVKVHGATGDGTTDDTSAISAAMDAANSAGKPLYFPPGTYLCGQIAAKAYAPRITGAGADLVTIKQKSGIAGSVPLWDFTGSIGSNLTLNADAAEGASQIVLTSTSTGLAAGDLILISSSTLVDSVDSATQTIGQMCRVKSVSVAATTTVTLYETLTDAFTTAASAKAQKVTAISNGLVSGISFDNPQPNTTTVYMLRFTYAENITIENCAATRLDNPFVMLRDTYRFLVRNCRFSNFNNTPASERNPYGVLVACASAHGVVTGCQADRVRHLFTADGFESRPGCPYNIMVANCTDSNSLNASFDTHPAARNITFIGCTSHGSNGPGLQSRGRGVRFIGCTVEGARYGWRGVLATQDNEIRDCTFRNIAAPPDAMDDAHADGGSAILVVRPATGLKVVNCTFKNTAKSPICFSSTATASSDVVVRGCLVENPCTANTSGNRDFVRGISSPVVTSLRVENNRFIQTSGSATMQYLVAALGAGSSAWIDGNDLPTFVNVDLIDSTTKSGAGNAIQIANTNRYRGLAVAGYLYENTGATGTVTLDLTTGVDFWQLTLTGNTTLAISNVPANSAFRTAHRLRLLITQDATGSRTFTWPSGFRFAGGGSTIAITSTASRSDYFEFIWVSGATQRWVCVTAQQNIALA